MPPKKDNILANRIQQFELDQQKAPAQTTAAPQKKTSIPPTSQNPYIQARHKILSKYPEWRRNEIATMEKTGNINNRFYDDFVHEVAVLGDSLS